MLGQHSLEPTSHYYISQRLKLHFVDWGNPNKPLLALIHGGSDHARTWDWVARALRHDYHIIAPDLRGHGDSEWARGSRYTMIEYVADLAQLLTQLDSFPVTLIGHSIGGAIVLQYSGVCHDNVAKVVAIEGLGPPLHRLQAQKKSPHKQMQGWITQMRHVLSNVAPTPWRWDNGAYIPCSGGAPRRPALGAQALDGPAAFGGPRTGDQPTQLPTPASPARQWLPRPLRPRETLRFQQVGWPSPHFPHLLSGQDRRELVHGASM